MVGPGSTSPRLRSWANRRAQARTRLGPGYATATPDTLQRRFLDTPGTITSNGDTITVTLSHRAYSPVLRQSSLPAETTIPWWHNHRLRFQFSED